MTPTVAQHELDSHLRRIVGEYREMPGLSLTPVQAARLWGVPVRDAEWILRLLAATGVLKRNAAGSYVMDTA